MKKKTNWLFYCVKKLPSKLAGKIRYLVKIFKTMKICQKFYFSNYEIF